MGLTASSSAGTLPVPTQATRSAEVPRRKSSSGFGLRQVRQASIPSHTEHSSSISASAVDRDTDLQLTVRNHMSSLFAGYYNISCSVLDGRLKTSENESLLYSRSCHLLFCVQSSWVEKLLQIFRDTTQKSLRLRPTSDCWGQTANPFDVAAGVARPVRRRRTGLPAHLSAGARRQKAVPLRRNVRDGTRC